MAQKDPIGKQIQKVREERRLSVPELAAILDIPKDRIYKWEQGKGAPRFEDRQIVDKWLVDGSWKNVPLGALEVTKPEADYVNRNPIKNPGDVPGLVDRLKDKEEIIQLLREKVQLQNRLEQVERTLKEVVEVLRGLRPPAPASSSSLESIGEIQIEDGNKSESRPRTVARK